MRRAHDWPADVERLSLALRCEPRDGRIAVASGIVQLLLIVSGVLVARSLGPEDRGYLALIIVISGICFLVAGMGLPSAATCSSHGIPITPGRSRFRSSGLASSRWWQRSPSR